MGNAVRKSCIKNPELTVARPHEETDSLAYIPNKLFTLDDAIKPMKIKIQRDQKPSHIPPESYSQAKPTKCAVLMINNAAPRSQAGVLIDMKNLNVLFSKLKFKIKSLNKLTTHEMVKSIKSFAQAKNLNVFDMCIIVIICDAKCGPNDNTLTEISGIDGQYISKLKLIKQFNDEQCPQLAGKPKLFIFQGHYFDGATSDEYANAHKGGFNDMFIANSLLMGSLQEQRIASYYIQALCKVFMTHICDKDVESMIKLVEEIVYTHNRSTQHTHYDNIRFKKCYINASN